MYICIWHVLPTPSACTGQSQQKDNDINRATYGGNKAISYPSRATRIDQSWARAFFGPSHWRFRASGQDLSTSTFALFFEPSILCFSIRAPGFFSFVLSRCWFPFTLLVLFALPISFRARETIHTHLTSSPHIYARQKRGKARIRAFYFRARCFRFFCALFFFTLLRSFLASRLRARKCQRAKKKRRRPLLGLIQ
jgi:hypothetical protein